MSVQLLKRKFTVQEYHKMAEAGILTQDDRVELIRGEILKMSPIGMRHAACINRLNHLFFETLGKQVILAIQNPVRLNGNSEPQPDVVLLKPRADFYSSGHPQPQDIFLIIEVSDTTAKYDREFKVPLYAENQILELWLVDLNENCIEVYRDPATNIYQNVQHFRAGQSLTIQAFEKIRFQVDDIFG